MAEPPANPKLYHIVHVDRLESIVADGCLFSDAFLANRRGTGTGIGMDHIKERRLLRELKGRPGLKVGGCVPFYFCPRSVMLFLLARGNHPKVGYKGGQGPIIHLEFDLNRVVQWAKTHGRRWAFTLSNAGSSYFEVRYDLHALTEVNWEAVGAQQWSGDFKEGKQAEFLVEENVSWELVERIGVLTQSTGDAVLRALGAARHRPDVEVKTDWYY